MTVRKVRTDDSQVEITATGQRPRRRTFPSLRNNRPPLQAVGDDPDYRFSLANERTFLAWIRTSLALLAGGIAVSQLVPSFGIRGGREVLGIALVGLSLLVSLNSYRNWESHERAMRLGTSLPRPSLTRTLSAGLILISVVTLILVLVMVVRMNRP
jgi:putative membrane protein